MNTMQATPKILVVGCLLLLGCLASSQAPAGDKPKVAAMGYQM